jgi:hypothetical protein
MKRKKEISKQYIVMGGQDFSSPDIKYCPKINLKAPMKIVNILLD